MVSTPEQNRTIRTIRIWRLVKSKHAATAFEGEGAFRYGGRWNSRGQRVVYASGSLSLAALEVLVHLDPSAHLPGLSAFPIDVPGELLQVEDFSHLDQISGGLPWSLRTTCAWGDAWCTASDRPVLQIPSAIVPNESNFLLNPQHPDFTRLRIGLPETFTLDARLGH